MVANMGLMGSNGAKRESGNTVIYEMINMTILDGVLKPLKANKSQSTPFQNVLYPVSFSL